MSRALGTVLAAAVASIAIEAGCNDPPAPVGLSHDALVAQLSALPGVTVTETATQTAGYTYFVLHFTQPVDHDDPSRGTFQEEVSLLHRDTIDSAPVVVQTTGYADFTLDTAVELTQLLDANQVSIEHRYYGTSMPVPCDWSRLTIWQMAEDEHAIVEALKSIYTGAFITTGGSKGGMTAIYHRRYHPDDVAGTVAYVAPLSLAAPDTRYADFIETIGPLACRSFVRDVARELLANRREAIEARAMAQMAAKDYHYTQIELGPAVEAAITALEWAFWQYHGEAECAAVPTPAASDDALFAFLDSISPIRNNADDRVARSQPYFYQSFTQLGYPDYGTSYLAPYREYDDDDYANTLPIAAPTYDPTAMRDIAAYVKSAGAHLLFVYGEWDPWTAGRFDLGDATDAASFVQPEGTHTSQIRLLERSDKDAAFAKLRAWTGVTPMPSRVLVATDAASERELAPVVRSIAPRAPK